MKHNWEYKKLGETCNLSAGGDKPSETQKYMTEDCNIPIFSNGIENEGLYGFCQKPKVDVPAITISGRGTIGVPFLRMNPFVPIIRLIVVIPSKKIFIKFLYYWILHRKFAGNGVAVPQLTVPMIKDELIPIPSMEIQEQIVAELDKINEVIADCRELLRTLDSLAQSLFYDYFGDPVTNPKGWEKIQLNNIGQIITGSTPSTKNHEYYNSPDICFIKPGDIDGDNISFINQSKDYISRKAFDSCCRKLPVDTVLMTCIGIIGKIGILKVEANCNQQINALLPNAMTNPIFLAYTLKAYKHLFSEAANGPVVKLLNKSAFSSFFIPVPTITLQDDFASRIEKIEEQKKAVEETIATLQTLLDSRMDYWFN